VLNSARDDVFRKEDLFMQVKDRLFEALSNQIEGDVLASDLSRSLYSSGASLYRIKPRAIVQPRSTNDLVATIRFAREQKPELSEYFPEKTEATLFIEFQEDSDEKLLDKFDSVRKCLLEDNDLAVHEIKALFDPYGIMNPGVIISENDNLLGENLKYGPDFTIVQTGTSFDATSLQEQITNCSGCASCRSYCPMASSHLEEWAKGRGKVNLCRELMSGKLDPGILEDPAFKKIIDS